MNICIVARDIGGVYQTVNIQVGNTLLLAVADNQGIRIDPDVSIVGDNLDTAMTVLLRLADHRPVYAYIDSRDPDHQRLAASMARLGGTDTDTDGRFLRWTIGKDDE